MKGEERRDAILHYLKGASGPVKGGELSTIFNVSRQIVVQDIALVRASGVDIVSTPQGYVILPAPGNSVKRVVAVKHNENEIEDELKTIVSMGGRVLDVTIEHKIYGEITGRLMLKSIFDVDHFMKRLKDEGARPLSQLTQGVHLHTLEADDPSVMDRIINKLKEKGYLLSQEV